MIVWDGNNDTPFIKPDLHLVVCDPHRPGHELRYHPGETNLRMADVCVVNKTDTAPPEGRGGPRLDPPRQPRAEVVLAASTVPRGGRRTDDIRGKRVLAVEDGPTLARGDDLRRRRARRQAAWSGRARRPAAVRRRLDRGERSRRIRTSTSSSRRWATGASRWRS